MKATAIRDFLRNEAPVKAGQEFECPRHEFAKWAALGFVQPYETKVQPVPEKKSEPSSASQAAPASRKRTSKKRTKRTK